MAVDLSRPEAGNNEDHDPTSALDACRPLSIPPFELAG